MSYNLDVSKISAEDWELNKCKEYATYILTNYSKTEKQLRDKLKQCKKKYSDKAIDETIKYLKKVNFLNDEEFAKRFIELQKDKYSKKVLKEKLYLKGISKKIIENLMTDETIGFDDSELIKKLLLKKCPEYYNISDTMDIKEKQKIVAFLYRKGFNYDKISDIMRFEG